MNMYKLLRSDAFLSLILFCSLLLFSLKFLNLWFTMDDTSCIYASTMSITDLLFNRNAYLLFNKMFYTPLLPVSFKLDFLLFGLNPLGYHLHSLLAAFLTGLIGYKVYRLYLPRFESWAGTFVFLLSYPVVTNIGWITRKHYLWGTFFFLLSFYSFRKAEAGNKWWLFPLSVASYFTALLFKEAFAALPAVIFIMASGGIRTRVLKSLPYLVILGLYFVMRFSILGGLGGNIGIVIPHTFSSIAGNYFLQMNLFSKAVWGLPAVFLPFLFLIVFIVNRRVSFALFILFLLLTSPFMFIKTPETVNSSYLIYFPSKMMLPLFLISGLLPVAFHYCRDIKIKIVSSFIAIFFFGMQCIHAPDSYAGIRQQGEYYKGFSLPVLERNIKGNDVLLVQEDAIFFNYFYGSHVKLNPNELIGSVITLDNPDLLGLLSALRISKTEDIFIEGKWIDTNKRPDKKRFSLSDAIVPPMASVSQHNNFLTFVVTDKREGEFYGALKTSYSSRNTSIQTARLSVNTPFKFGIVTGKDVVYLIYCNKDNLCSKPVILEPTGEQL